MEGCGLPLGGKRYSFLLSIPNLGRLERRGWGSSWMNSTAGGLLLSKPGRDAWRVIMYNMLEMGGRPHHFAYRRSSGPTGKSPLSPQLSCTSSPWWPQPRISRLWASPTPVQKPHRIQRVGNEGGWTLSLWLASVGILAGGSGPRL